jgi:glycerol-3-phosphate dehydrogenase
MDELADVAVIGAGINGAAIGQTLTRAGYRVALLDQGDIGGGTSQASTMLIWGGLLYLRHLEVSTVLALSRDRDRLIAERPDLVQAQSLLYIPSGHGAQRLLISSALSAYWAMGAGRRRWPRRLDDYPERAMLAEPDAPAYAFEEAALVGSDARFVLDWALDAERRGAAVWNYVRAESITQARDGAWRLGLCDTLTGASIELGARLIVNAAGAWTDAVNATARIVTPWRHAFSRGVSLSLPRDPRHTRHLVFDNRDGDVTTLAPWGPVALWSSTDTLHADLAEARQPATADVASLLGEWNRHLRRHATAADVLAIRTGVRPLPVAHDAGDAIDRRVTTRHHRLHLDDTRPWISVYGGKLSGCMGLAAQVRGLVAQRLARPPAAAAPPPGPAPARDMTRFPGLDVPVVSAPWAAAHEHCCTLEDYLRRRTNIAQWTPNGGFGANFEHAPALERIALDIHHGDAGRAERDLLDYWHAVSDTRDVIHGREPRPGPALPTGLPPLVLQSREEPRPLPATAPRRRSLAARWRRA